MKILSRFRKTALMPAPIQHTLLSRIRYEEIEHVERLYREFLRTAPYFRARDDKKGRELAARFLEWRSEKWMRYRETQSLGFSVTVTDTFSGSTISSPSAWKGSAEDFFIGVPWRAFWRQVEKLD